MKENYRMILVDDEDDVRGRILSKINEDSGFTVVGKAGNGYDAIDLIEKYKPHVVLTDIKMPFINGIELAKIIRRDYPTTKVAFISGYDEFEYAREAIELNVVSYLMKPVTSEDINSFLAKLKEALEHEFDYLSNTRLIHQRYNDSIPLLVNSYLSTYRYRNELNNQDISHLEQYQLSFATSNYIVAVIGFENNEEIKSTEETKIFIGNLISRVFKKVEYVHHFLIPEGVVLLIKDDHLKQARFIDIELYELVQFAEEYRQTTLEIGVSSVFHDFRHYPEGCRHAEQALRHSKYFNIGQIIYYDDIDKKETKQVLLDETQLSEFEYLLKFGDKEDIKRSLDQLLNLSYTEKNIIIDPQLLIIKLSNALINFSSSINVDITEVCTDNIVSTLSNFKELDEMNQFIYEWIFRDSASWFCK